jgi:molybdopterin biosynthesis enzyme
LAYNLNDLHFTLTYFGSVKEHWQYSLPGRIQPALATLEAIAEDRLQLEADAIRRAARTARLRSTEPIFERSTPGATVRVMAVWA